MPYIGNNLATQFQAFATQTITGDGSTSYTLDRAVANGKELLVYINNVKQEEGSGKSYTASGTTITFSEAVASGDSCYVVFLGSAVQTVTPPDGSIVSGMIANANLEMPNTLDMNGKELILDADADTSITADTDDQIDIKIAGSDSLRIKASEIENVSGSFTLDVDNFIILDADGGRTRFADDGTIVGSIQSDNSDFNFVSEVSDKDIVFSGNDGGSGIEAMRIDFSEGGNVLVGTTYGGIQVSGIAMSPDGNVDIGAGSNPLDVNRQSNDGSLIRFYQAGSEEGEITVSGSTVSLSGFQGSHESSGIPSDTPVGTVVSTIDTIDTKTIIAENGSKSQQDRADHPKIEVSSSVGDKAVYGVLARWRTIEENEDVKAMIASVGTGSVRVTGACAKGDLLESNGDGTAKVQSDDIVRSKTIGKVTIGNSNTGVKLVSCVLYCG
jgi:hypothetical protein